MDGDGDANQIREKKMQQKQRSGTRSIARKHREQKPII